MKRGFTMIELIFVIVVLGILAAVALPKFQSVGEQAKEATLKSFTGTMRATVGSSLWRDAMSNYDGNISKLNIDSTTKLSTYTDLPTAVTDANISQCAEDGATPKFVIVTKKVGDNYYGIGCNTGTSVKAPTFKLYKAKDQKTVGDEVNTSKDTCILGCN